MLVYEDECCDCAVPGYPCLGEHCSRRHVPHYYCDDCGEEIWWTGFNDEPEEYDGKHYCKSCLTMNGYGDDEEEEDE